MAGTLNLIPEVGTQLAEGFNEVLNGLMLEKVVACFQAAKEVGEDTNMFEGTKGNFERFQNYYNNDLIELVRKGQQGFEEYTDMATYLTKIQTANSIQEQDVGTVTANNYDACKAL